MRLGTVIGTVTLTVKSPRLRGGRMLLVQPWASLSAAGAKEFAPVVAVYDELGAAAGQTVSISEGAEASCPFPTPTPVDAYCAALVDEVFYEPSRKEKL